MSLDAIAEWDDRFVLLEERLRQGLVAKFGDRLGAEGSALGGLVLRLRTELLEASQAGEASLGSCESDDEVLSWLLEQAESDPLFALPPEELEALWVPLARHFPFLRRYAGYRLWSVSGDGGMAVRDEDDVVLTVAWKYLRAVARGEAPGPNDRGLRAFLRTTAHNESVNLVRWWVRQIRTTSLDQEPDGDGLTLQERLPDESANVVEQVMADLAEVSRPEDLGDIAGPQARRFFQRKAEAMWGVAEALFLSGGEAPRDPDEAARRELFLLNVLADGMDRQEGWKLACAQVDGAIPVSGLPSDDELGEYLLDLVALRRLAIRLVVREAEKLASYSVQRRDPSLRYRVMAAACAALRPLCAGLRAFAPDDWWWGVALNTRAQQYLALRLNVAELSHNEVQDVMVFVCGWLGVHCTPDRVNNWLGYNENRPWYRFADMLLRTGFRGLLRDCIANLWSGRQRHIVAELDDEYPGPSTGAWGTRLACIARPDLARCPDGAEVVELWPPGTPPGLAEDLCKLRCALELYYAETLEMYPANRAALRDVKGLARSAHSILVDLLVESIAAAVARRRDAGRA